MHMIELATDKPIDETINPLSLALSAFFMSGTKMTVPTCTQRTEHFDQCHDGNNNGVDPKDWSEVSRQ